MGFYTFTFANKTPTKNKRGDYAVSCLAPYGGYSAILTPDNKLIKEPCYEGYGIWNDRDVFVLLAEWNKDDLPRLINSGALDGAWFDTELKPIALAWAADDMKTAADLAAKGNAVIGDAGQIPRTIGIWLNTRPEKLKYPIKIVSVRSRCPAYDTLPYSIQTQ